MDYNPNEDRGAQKALLGGADTVFLPLSGERSGFAGHGYQQVPPEVIRGRILYAHPEGRFVNKLGQRVKHCYTPNSYSQVRRRNKVYPQLSNNYGSKDCHYLIISFSDIK